MLHIDYNWDCSELGIKLDEEFDVDKLGWQGGDCFKLVNINGRCYLRKLESVEQFFLKEPVNVQTK